MSKPSSSLFSAIVLSGIALTGSAAACGSETTEPSTATDAGQGAPGDGGGSNGNDAASATGADGGGTSTTSDGGDGGCPPGSERPVPPCDLIK